MLKIGQKKKKRGKMPRRSCTDWHGNSCLTKSRWVWGFFFFFSLSRRVVLGFLPYSLGSFICFSQATFWWQVRVPPLVWKTIKAAGGEKCPQKSPEATGTLPREVSTSAEPWKTTATTDTELSQTLQRGLALFWVQARVQEATSIGFFSI